MALPNRWSLASSYDRLPSRIYESESSSWRYLLFSTVAYKKAGWENFISLDSDTGVIHGPRCTSGVARYGIGVSLLLWLLLDIGVLAYGYERAQACVALRLPKWRYLVSFLLE
jgi:hypothetical protein